MSEGESKVQKTALTFVSLRLDLELLCQILLILPLHLSPNRLAIHEIARIADLLAVHDKHDIFEIFVLMKTQSGLEPGLGFARGKVLDTELMCAGVWIGDKF